MYELQKAAFFVCWQFFDCRDTFKINYSRLARTNWRRRHSLWTAAEKRSGRTKRKLPKIIKSIKAQNWTIKHFGNLFYVWFKRKVPIRDVHAEDAVWLKKLKIKFQRFFRREMVRYVVASKCIHHDDVVWLDFGSKFGFKSFPGILQNHIFFRRTVGDE